MIFQNIELHNVSELTQSPDGPGFIMHRAPDAVAQALTEQGRRMNIGGTGVELRFEINSEAGADITLCLRGDEPNARVIPVYYGSMSAGWQECLKTVFNTPTRIHVAPPAKMPLLERIHRDNHFPFDPRVVRLILPVSSYALIGVEGDVCPPRPEHLPARRLLAYGSSITHGSLSLLPVGCYAFRTAEALGMDLLNMGFAGSARMEKEMADFIAARQDWDIATLEMGINSLDMSEALFEERVRYFINAVASAHPHKPVFCIDIFYFSGDMDGSAKADAFRAIVKNAVRECGLANVRYVRGLDLSPLNSAGLSGDFVHPTLRAHELIADGLARAIKSALA